MSPRDAWLERYEHLAQKAGPALGVSNGDILDTQSRRNNSDSQLRHRK